MGLESIKNWSPTFNKDEFYLRIDDPECSLIYQGQILRNKQYESSGEKTSPAILPPVEQLSPKGLAILSATFSEKENQPNQPLIATGIEDLLHVAMLMKDALPGTRVPIIFQDIKGGRFKFHKSCILLERSDDNRLNAIMIDSVAEENRIFSDFIEQFMDKYALEFVGIDADEKFINFELVVFRPKPIDYPEKQGSLTRQRDGYQCGIYAIKDARMLINNEELVDSIKKSNSVPPENKYNTPSRTYVVKYSLPANALKSIQSKKDMALMSEQFGNDPVNRANTTLKLLYEKYKDVEGGYISHFSQKYYDQVNTFLDQHTPEENRTAANFYDAEQLTLDRLNSVYGPKTLPTNSLSNKT